MLNIWHATQILPFLQAKRYIFDEKYKKFRHQNGREPSYLTRQEMSIFHGLKLDPKTMQVEVMIGAPDPAGVDKDAVAALLPYGTVTVKVEQGGVTAEGMGGPGDTVIVSAAVSALVDIPEGAFRLA